MRNPTVSFRPEGANHTFVTAAVARGLTPSEILGGALAFAQSQMTDDEFANFVKNGAMPPRALKTRRTISHVGLFELMSYNWPGTSPVLIWRLTKKGNTLLRVLAVLSLFMSVGLVVIMNFIP